LSSLLELFLSQPPAPCAGGFLYVKLNLINEICREK
jgi:hypothetical protein